MNLMYRPPDEGEVFNTFHDMVHAAILCARTGTATLKEIYAACTRFGRVKCRKTGGWRLVTERRNWKSHVRHTLYTTEKFLRCPHDSDSWMLAPDFCYTLPQTTRQFTGPAPYEDDAVALPRGGSTRRRAKAAQRAQPLSVHTYKAGGRGDRQPAPARQRSAASRSQRFVAAGTDSIDGQDSDSNDHDAWADEEKLQEDQRGEDWEKDELDDAEAGDQPQSQQQPQGSYQEEFAADADAHGHRIRTAAARSYGIGSRNGRAQALLGVTAAVAAAAATGDEGLDLNDEETRTALHAAQEVLNNPAATKILLRLVQQHQEQQQKQHDWQQQQQRVHSSRLQQDLGRPCRSRRRRRVELDFEEDEGGQSADPMVDLEEEQAVADHMAMACGAAARQQQWQDEAIIVSDARYLSAKEACGPRPKQAMQQPHSTQQVQQSSWPGLRVASGSGGSSIGGGLSEASHRAPMRPGGGRRIGGFGATGPGQRVSHAGRLEGFTDRAGRGADRRSALPPAAPPDAVPAWQEDEDADGDRWRGHPDEDEVEAEWDEDGVGPVGWRQGEAAEHTTPGRGGKRMMPGPSAAAFARCVQSSPLGRGPRFLTPAQHLPYIPSAAHLNAATTAAAAAAAAAAVAAAAAAGKAPRRLAGHRSAMLGARRAWVESNGGGSFGPDAAVEAEAEEIFLQQEEQLQQLRYQATMNTVRPPPRMLRQLAEELQAYHSRSAAAAAAAAVAAVASAANVQKPRGYAERMVC